jgi:hypothetical protein
VGFHKSAEHLPEWGFGSAAAVLITPLTKQQT